MAKTFRLYSEGGAVINNGWCNSNQYNSPIIDNIDDPAGVNAKKEITSIPSPFARMDLVRAAYANVCKDGNLNGKTIHHKMVSYSLDIAQIFFNLKKYCESGLIEIIRWDKTADLNNLKQSADPKHRLLGETYDLFMSSDANRFNFNLVSGLYLLRYIGAGAPNQLTIIGSTSPTCLFYSPANEHDFLQGKIVIGNHNALDEADFVPLKDRDEEFIVWMWALSKALPNFATYFREVNNYMRDTYPHLSHALQNRINALTSTSLSADYEPLTIGMGIPVELFNVQLGTNKPINWGERSDFAINGTKPVVEKHPLVLPCDPFHFNWQYTSAPWQNTTQVPVYPNSDINNRTLPVDGSKYPYLTMTDFLEDTIIQCECQICTNDFFDGNLTNNTGDDIGFLLPVKRKYFDYFTTEDLKQNIKISCDNAPGGGYSVKVKLDIPTKAGKISFSRTYITGDTHLSEKNGVITSKVFTMLYSPKTRFVAATPDYILSLMCKDWDANIICVNNDNIDISPVLKCNRNEDAVGTRIDVNSPIMPTLAIDSNFDFIQLSSREGNGVAIPQWQGIAGGARFEFAVDFGTTNTHIEYLKNGMPSSETLNIPNNAKQIGIFNDDALIDYFKIPILQNFIPETIGKTNGIKFPMKTALSYKTATNWNTPTAPYVTGNMPFYYGSVSVPEYCSVETNLKWSTDAAIIPKIKCYLGSLMHIMRNKVVMEGGNLTATKVKWFYPTSMPAATVANIANIWLSLYKQHFGDNTGNLEMLPESIAPYNYYKNQYGTGVDVLTIDIGGGTSDAYIIDSNGNPAFITSFRFAANSLLGDGFANGGLAVNGYVNKFRPIINSILEANGLGIIKGNLDSLASYNNSSDFLSMLFSLKELPEVKNAKCENTLDFISMMQQSEGVKTLVLIFYTAIIYHLANFIKAKKDKGANIKEPACLAFSGNGSKLLQILGVNTQIGKDTLCAYTKAIFEKVNGHEYCHRELKLIIDPDCPKEATCKGALLSVATPDTVRISQMKDVLLGIDSSTMAENREYDSLNQSDFKGLEATINDFAEIFFQLAKEQDVKNRFGTISITDLKEYRDLFVSDIQLHTSNALIFMGLSGSATPIEDSLFFYPITVILTELARNIIK